VTSSRSTAESSDFGISGDDDLAKTRSRGTLAVSPLRIVVVSAALTLAAAASVLPSQVANAQAPSISIIIPSNHATISGTAQDLDATASPAVTQVQFEITGGTLTDSVIATATKPTIYGWIAQWDTTTVANGTYTLQSVGSYAGGADSVFSPPITLTVNNPPPSTTVELPANGATVGGVQSLDATASSGVTQVHFEISGGPDSYVDQVIAGSNPTYLGWLGRWNTASVPSGTYTLNSVASYADGVSGTSPPITFAVEGNPPRPAWRAYVAAGSGVSVINTATNAVTGSIPVAYPGNIAITPNGKTAYVVNSNTVSVINTATNALVGSPITVGSDPQGIAITPNGKTAYVVNEYSNTVSVINTATNTLTGSISVGSYPNSIAITPNGKTAYVVNYISNTVSVIDTATNTVTGSISAGGWPDAIAITPSGTTAYVVNLLYSFVSVINTATNAVTGSIPVAYPGSIAMSPDGTTAYVANSSGLSVIDAATNKVTGSILGAGPGNIAFTPDGATAYLANGSVIDTATNTVDWTLPVGTGFGHVAISPDQAPVARLKVTPTPAGKATTFDASASTVAFGTIAKYAWNFGDGSSATTATPTITHTYASAGTFSASVTETSSGGTSTTKVFTGQTMSRNGGPSARATATVVAG
jgi:YVTN family beta-propeller protein